MYCTNCGKEIKTGEVFCSGCGKMQGKPRRTRTYVLNEKRLIPKKAAYAIGGVALVITLITSVALGKADRKNEKAEDSQNYAERYGSQSQDPWEYFGGDDMYNPYGMYGGSGNMFGGSGGFYGDYGSSGSSGNPDAMQTPSPTLNPYWQSDENGKLPTDEGYRWPSGDDKYEYYMNSTIPKFESVTGVKLKSTKDNNGNIYYTYDMDEDAYKEYVKVIKDKGFKQSEFEVQGKNSYEKYTIGDDYFSEYLIIYHMNTSGEIVIMA